MCGRFAFTASRKQLLEWLLPSSPDIPPRYNIAPGQDIAAVRKPIDQRELVTLRWGLIPSWAKEIKSGYKMINARAESVISKPAFESV